MSGRGLLFDLDGTLADTAPDLVAVLNHLLAEHGRAPVPFAIARNVVSHGAIGLIRLGFGLSKEAPVEEAIRHRFLELYATFGHSFSRLFIDLDTILSVCSDVGAGWGVVTNKPAALTEPLLDHLGVLASAGAVVSGDTLATRKPDPAPLHYAARQLDVDPASCIYLGDAERDIVAGRAAGMLTVATS
ncbi:MAG: HAD-IA family hydrolase, partial [Gammaproteobacteria bacterium]